MSTTTVTSTNQRTNWHPIIGEETRSLLRHLDLPIQNEQTLIRESIEILSQSGNPFNPINAEIGLVFGYVQSGKTMSFTTLTALAKDNGYRIIIIIAGISTNLVAQSFTRLEKDLRLDIRNDLKWLSFKNPRIEDVTTRSQITIALSEWRDITFPEEEKKTIMITVMKQKDHLPNLQRLIETLNLDDTPVLIIDDEGDQHSMNTKARRNTRTGENRQSTIHRRIIELKNTIPHHTFIQYTATPQAPLFVDIMDNLSPNFIQLLTPGPEYTGGRTFFEDRQELVRVINDIDPESDLSSPPRSLLYALQIFFLGVVKGTRTKEGKKRSMMIHPSQLTYTHTDYFRFVSTIKYNYVEILMLPDGNPDKIDLLAEFQQAYNDLSQTTNNLPSFTELTGHRLRHAINSTVVQSLNSQRGNQTIVQWRNNYSFILIGGQAMDRGFTVEGLTVTYMPRSVGVGNADTIQQRARFFGYKNEYLGYCRVFLDEEARNAYRNYVNHEEDMRSRLAAHVNSGRPLNDWYREVFLPSDLNLSRAEIFSREFERTILRSEWWYTKIPHNSTPLIHSNLSTVRAFLTNNQFVNSGRFPSIEMSLTSIYDDLLSQLRFTSQSDFADYTALLYTLNLFIEENPDETGTIFLMGSIDQPRERNLKPNNEINQLFQGRNSNYQGDRLILGQGITFQIHTLNLLRNDIPAYNDVIALSVYLPTEVGQEIIRWA